MNREEILARSQKENENKPDERSKGIQTQANSISQVVGLVMCFALGFIGKSVTGDASYLRLGMAIFTSMYAAERLACASMEKTKEHWIGAIFATIAAVFIIAVYFLYLFGILGRAA